MNESELKNNWFKTWLDKDYNKLDQASECLPSEEEYIAHDEILSNNITQIPLNQLLNNIPLAYSPITKQLHVLTPNDQKKSSFSNQSGNESVCKKSIVEANCNEEEVVLSTHSNEKIDEKEEKLQKTWSKGLNDCAVASEKTKIEEKNNWLVKKAESNSLSSVTFSISDQLTNVNQDESNLCELNSFDIDDESVRSICSHDSNSTFGESSKFFGEENQKEKNRRGFSAFFSRNVFTWKSTNSLTSPGWKIFGRSPGLEKEIFDLETGNHKTVTNLPSSVKKYEDVIVSSSALILHNRPANLPAKSLDEQQKHILEYEQIVEAARKKEAKETKKRKKQLQQQLKFEEQLTNASKIWSCEIIPKWETMKNMKKTRDLWWAGIPPSIRGKIWKLAIGNELNITHQLYEICAARAQERLKNLDLNNVEEDKCCNNDANKESSVELIQLDISRTFPQLCIFQKGGPYYDILHCLLGAYVCYRPDVGYVQGMSFIAAVLILNLEPADAFVCFANLLNRPCHLAFFTLNQSIMNAYYNAYNGFFKENLPRLSQHFQESRLTPDLYLLDWVYSVFAKAMPLDITCRVWDVFLRDGEEFIFRTALGILHLHQEKLLKLDFINGAQFLRKLPEDLSADLLFRSIDSIKMCMGKLKFGQVLTNLIEKCSSR